MQDLVEFTITVAMEVTVILQAQISTTTGACIFGVMQSTRPQAPNGQCR